MTAGEIYFKRNGSQYSLRKQCPGTAIIHRSVKCRRKLYFYRRDKLWEAARLVEFFFRFRYHRRNRLVHPLPLLFFWTRKVLKKNGSLRRAGKFPSTTMVRAMRINIFPTVCRNRSQQISNVEAELFRNLKKRNLTTRCSKIKIYFRLSFIQHAVNSLNHNVV